MNNDIITPATGPSDIICNIDELPCGRTNFKVTVAGKAKRVCVDKNACDSRIAVWNDSARSRYDPDADLHTIHVGGRRCCGRLLRLRHVAKAAEIEQAQKVLFDNRDLI